MMDLQAMCRLCYFKLHEPQNIFDTPGLLDRIVKFTDVKIVKGDGLPNSICDFCELKLQISDKFSRQVSLADKRIRAARAAAQLDNGLHENKQDNNLGTRNSEYAPWRNSELSSELRIPLQFSNAGNSKNSHGEESTNTPVLYSYSTARSIVAAYKALISRCVRLGFPEDFIPPSYVGILEQESNSEGEMQASRVAPICRRRNKKKLQRQADDVPPKQPRSVPVTSRCIRTPDPLNLLKVKRIQRLIESDHTSDDENQTVSSFKESAEDMTPYNTRLRTRTQLGDIKNKNYYESSIDSDTNCSKASYGSCSTEISQCSIEHERQKTKSASVFDFPVSRTIIHDKTATVANEIPDNMCPVCKKVCANATGLWMHMCVVHRADRCEICKASTPSKEDFRKHMYNHHAPFNTSPKIVFTCTICSRICKSRTGLLLHLRRHTNSLPRL